MERTLEGRTAVVSGGSRGIGAAVAHRLTAAGAVVVIGYRSDADAARAVVERGDAVEAVRGDVTDPASARALVAAARQRTGRLDVAVSSAGVEHFGELAAIGPDDVRRVLDTNVAGQLYLAQAAAGVMTAGGRIVLLSSVSAHLGVHGHALYAASKAAVEAVVRNLAVELGPRGILVNAVAPGGTLTDMAAEHAASYTHPALRDVDPDAVQRSQVPLGRWAQPAEIAEAVAFLVSAAGSYVTGSTLAVDGGMG